MEMPNRYISNLYRAVLVFVIILSLFFAVKLLTEFKSYRLMSGVGTITLTGHGEVTAVPDIANIYFTINKEAKTAKEAQEAVALVERNVLEFLQNSSVDEKDIQASNASFYPKYEYENSTRSLMPCDGYNCPPQPGRSVIVGYEASESITVKVRNIDDAGKIMQGLGALAVSNLNGPNFAIDDEDDLKAEARKMAIEDARKKAKTLAKDLGVRLGSVSNFSESGNYYPMYSKAVLGMGDAESAPAPAELPKGENTVSSDVTITYEIR